MSLMSATVDASELLRALERIPASVQVYTKRAAEVTANRIVSDARTRLAGQLSKDATGKTVAGITMDELPDGTGYIVTSERQPMPSVPLWLDKGTVHMAARPFFDVSAQIETGPNERRMVDAVQQAIDAEGLGQ